MGHKVNPVGFRIGVNRNWDSRWYADGDKYSEFLLEDIKIRKFVASKCKTNEVIIDEKTGKRIDSDALLSHVEIERKKNNDGSYKLVALAYVARPGVLLGKDSARIAAIRKEFAKIVTSKNARLDVVEVRKPNLDAHIVAQQIAHELENRASFRVAQKKAIQRVRKDGAKGIRTLVGGRLGGADIARNEGYKDGIIPLHTLRSDIDFAVAEARTTYGRLGVKVWICRGNYKTPEELEEEAKAPKKIEDNRRPRFNGPRKNKVNGQEGGNE